MYDDFLMLVNVPLKICFGQVVGDSNEHPKTFLLQRHGVGDVYASPKDKSWEIATSKRYISISTGAVRFVSGPGRWIWIDVRAPRPRATIHIAKLGLWRNPAEPVGIDKYLLLKLWIKHVRST